MRIAVCMKQVPALSDGGMDEKTGTLIRSGQKAVPNIYDLSALEAALRSRESAEDENFAIDVYTMGPKSAEALIREAYAYGADHGYLICDSKFAGADVLATSYTLARAIRENGPYDLVFCGKQTTDGDTSQVSAALAKWLELPSFSGVTDVRIIQENGKDRIYLKQRLDDRVLTLKAGLPSLIAVEKETFPARMPSLKLRLRAGKKEITRIEAGSFRPESGGIKEKEYFGQKGSATRVIRIFPPERAEKHPVAELDGKEAGKQILDIWEGLGLRKERNHDFEERARDSGLS